MLGNKAPLNLLSLSTAAFLALGVALAALRGDLYWTALAVWAVALIVLPQYVHRGRELSSINGLMLLVALPYIAGSLGGGGSGLMPISSIWYLLLSSPAIFSLCLVTIALINSIGGMRFNLNFAMQASFMFYATIVVLQSPVFFYSDLLLGTSIIPSNQALMDYIVLAMGIGLLMTVVFLMAARAAMDRRCRGTAEGAPE